MQQLKMIPNFPTYYINTNGEVYSLKTKRFRKPRLVRGYFNITLSKDLKTYQKSIHRLVLETFIGSCPEGTECCHKNGIRTDNRLKNLRWDTRKNNFKDAIKHGTHISLHQKGETHPRAKLKRKDIRMIIYMYKIGLFSQRKIAKIYNISYQNINAIITKRNWKHIWTKRKKYLDLKMHNVTLRKCINLI